MRVTELINESKAYFKSGDYDKAIQKLNHALIIEPYNYDIKKLLLDNYLLKDEFANVLDTVNDLLKENNNEIELLFIKAVCLVDLEELEEALKICSFIISKKKDFYSVYGVR